MRCSVWFFGREDDQPPGATDLFLDGLQAEVADPVAIMSFLTRPIYKPEVKQQGEVGWPDFPILGYIWEADRQGKSAESAGEEDI